MAILVTRECVNGTLLSLRSLLGRLSFVEVDLWAFHDVELHFGKPFGIATLEFERLTREMPGGFLVAQVDLPKLLETDMQIVNGRIEAMASGGTPLFGIECIDSGQWEIDTQSAELAAELERRGFERQDR